MIIISITLTNIRKQYDQQPPTLTNVNATIQTGEFFVIVGPSGCGKSTLLRMIAGLTPITSGEINIDGQVVNELPPKDRKLSMVFQSYALLPFYTVWDNVAFGLRARKMPPAEIETRVKDALDKVDLMDLKDRKPRSLSGGQRQRVALARAVASDTKICLMDEPLSNLDAQLRIKMRQEIYALQRKLGLTLIYVTHDQVEAMTMADHIMVLHEHRVQQIGTPSEIYQDPENEFVAQFFGVPQINVLPAQKVSEHHLIAGNTLRIHLAQKIPAVNFKVGIRPNHLMVEPCAELDSNAEVVNAEFLGDETIIYAKIDSGHIVRILAPGLLHFSPFEKVRVSVIGSVLLFDIQGRRTASEMEALVNA